MDDGEDPDPVGSGRPGRPGSESGGPGDAGGGSVRSDGFGVDVDWTLADLDRFRELYGRARYEPGTVDPATLRRALVEGNRYRLTAARAFEAYAADDPSGVAPYLDDLVATMDGDPDVARPLGRAVGHLAGETDGVVEALADRLYGEGPNVAAAEGIETAAGVDPVGVGQSVEALIDALDGSDAIREPVIRALGTVFAADPPGDADARDRIGGLLSSPDPTLRGAGARAVALAAADGCEVALDSLPGVVAVLERPLGGWVSVVTSAQFEAVTTPGLTRASVVDDVLAGLVAVAETRPTALTDYVGSFQNVDAFEDEDRAATVLGHLAAAEEPIFETLLERSVPGGVLSSARATVSGGNDRAREALVAAAPRRIDLLADRPDAIRAILEHYPGTGHRLVAAVAAERPDAVEWAVDPLLAHVDDEWSRIVDAGTAFDALGELAPAHPRIADRLVDRLATREGGERAAAVAALRGVASAAPGALQGTTGPRGTPVERLLADALSTDATGEQAAFALAHLGIAAPEAVADLGEPVADQVRRVTSTSTTPGERAIHVLASVVTYADPGAMESLGYTVLARASPTDAPAGGLAGRDVDGIVLLLGALCSSFDRFVDSVLDRLSTEDGEDRLLLRVLAESGWPTGTALAGRVADLVAATDRDDDDERAVATKALASALTDAPDPPRAVTDRLAALLYDPDPAVRRWAAFGAGEALAAGAGDDRLRERLRRVGGAGATPAADLALVRAGERAGYDAVDDLAAAGMVDYRAIARTAVRELAAVQRQSATEAVARIRSDHVDPWVRAAAADALDPGRAE